MALQHRLTMLALAGGLLGFGAAAAISPTAAAQQPSVASDDGALQGQLREVGARLAEARTRHGKLQVQVTQLERQNDARQRQLQQRDAEVAALREQLESAGVAVPAGSAGG